MYFILVSIIAIVGWLVSENLKRKTKKFSFIPLENGLNGKSIAEKMLYDHGIYDVQVVVSDGFLTDHYDLISKTISLSKDIYRGTNIFAAAVAAHETGHAIQHAKAYIPLKIRSALIPAVNFSARWVQWIILVGLLLTGSGIERGNPVLFTGIGMFAITTIFSFITLPIEINASMRALAWLDRTKMINYSNYNNAKSALKAAAYTYIVVALSSLATLFYYITIYMRRRN